jgi:hypothetical protein
MFMITAVLTAWLSAIPQTGSSVKPESPVGNWRGMSVCQVRPSACHDEDSLYHFKLITASPEAFELQADKIVDGKPITMGTETCRYNAKNQLACPVSGSGAMLIFQVNGNEMSGTMTLADGTLWRKLALKKG